jgi:hypothetical protein
MITNNRVVEAYGFEMRASRVKMGYSNAKVVSVELSNVERVENMFSNEAKEVVEATNHLSIIKDNVDHQGFTDPQMLVEHMVDLTENCDDRDGALLFYEKNLVKSLMRDVYRTFPNMSSVKDKQHHSARAAHFVRLVKFEGTVRFMLATDDPLVLPTDKAVSVLLNTDAEEHYSLELAEFRGELSTLALWFIPGGNSSLAQKVPLPEKKKKHQKKKAPAAVTDAPGPKKSKLSEHVEKIWHVAGRLCTRWVKGDWAKMSDEEKMEYRAQRGSRGNWPDEVPPCEQWIRLEGQNMFRTIIKH